MLRPLSVVLALLVIAAVWRAAVAQPEPLRSNQSVERVVSDLDQIRQSIESHPGDQGQFQQAARNVVQGGYRAPPPFQHGFQERFATPFAATYAQPPRAPTPPSDRPADVPPHSRLQATAFELDRLAYQLETSCDYEDADAIREAAQSLRGLARKLEEKARPTNKEVGVRATGDWAPNPSPSDSYSQRPPSVQPPQPADPAPSEDD